LESDELLELRNQFSRESDPAKKEEIVSRILSHVQTQWERLFKTLSNEQNPDRMLLMLAELDDLFETRRTQLGERN
jgi:hypothetical protein